MGKEKIEKKSKISFDGRNLMTRIPKAIEKKAKLKKGENLLWKSDGDKLEVKREKQKTQKTGGTKNE